MRNPRSCSERSQRWNYLKYLFFDPLDWTKYKPSTFSLGSDKAVIRSTRLDRLLKVVKSPQGPVDFIRWVETLPYQERDNWLACGAGTESRDEFRREIIQLVRAVAIGLKIDPGTPPKGRLISNIQFVTYTKEVGRGARVRLGTAGTGHGVTNEPETAGAAGEKPGPAVVTADVATREGKSGRTSNKVRELIKSYITANPEALLKELAAQIPPNVCGSYQAKKHIRQLANKGIIPRTWDSSINLERVIREGKRRHVKTPN